MSLDDTTRERIASLIQGNDVMLFMKGSRHAPQCGFSATVVGILDSLLPEYQTFDVLADESVRKGIKAYSSWPTIPQLYIRGEFIGGCDIIQELQSSGELAQKLGIELGDVSAPEIRISDEAAEGLRQAMAGAPPDQSLHFAIDARYRSSLFTAPLADGDIAVTANGVVIHMDRLTALRAEEAHIDVAATPHGPGFQVRLPHAPTAIRQMPVKELKRRLDAGERFEFIDVRSPEERATACLPGTTLLSENVAKRLESLPRDTTIVFHCHHGDQGQAAAEHFASLGFTDVHNVVGGIDAWSREIDPEVPRY